MRRSVLALIGSLAGIAYLAYLAFSFFRIENPETLTLRVAGVSLQFASILPCILIAALADLSGWISYAAGKRGFSLAAAILYCAILPFLPAWLFLPLALALIALADFLIPLILHRARAGTAGPAPEWQDAANPDGMNDSGPESPFDPALELLDETDLEETGDQDGELELEAEDDAGDDAPAWLEDEEEPDIQEREHAQTDGTGVFLGIFMALAAAALIGIVIYGLVAGKLPFAP